MRKVTTINLNNNAYQIEEEGYEALNHYMQDAERALAGNPDRAEILSDLEQAIADKCRAALGRHKDVVSGAEIERILTEMGPVAGRAESSADVSGPAGAAKTVPGGSSPPPYSPPRRLYRIREGRMIWGVCTGLGAYFGRDSNLVRLAFVLLFFAGGSGFIAYIAMALIVPVAKTPEEVAAAHGQPYSAQELVDHIRKKREQSARTP